MNNKIRCVITDDEPFAREGLTGYVEKVGFLELIGICEDAVELTQLIREQKPDLLFLDIQMPILTGVEFLKSIANPPKVIFATAYEQYALQGFELDILDYLVKPISFERFLKAACKAKEYFDLKRNPDLQKDSFTFIKVEGKLEKLNFDEILYIEGMENYLIIYTNDRRLIIHSTIKSFFEKLPPGFIQTHKSYIVPIEKVTTIDGCMLVVGTHNVPVSRKLREWVLEQIVKTGYKS